MDSPYKTISLVRYFFKTYFEKKVQCSLIVLTGVFNTFLEGIGITLLIPVFTIFMEGGLDSAQSQSNLFIQSFSRFYAFLGMELTIVTALAGFVVVALISGVFLLFQRMFITSFDYHYEYDMTCDIYEKILSARWFNLAKLLRSELINTLAKEISFARVVFQNFLNFLSFGIKISIFIIFSFLISVPLTLVILGIGVVLGISVYHLNKRVRYLGEEARDTRSGMMNVLINVLDNLKFIKLMSLESSNYEDMERASRTVRVSHTRLEWQKHFITFLNTSIMTVMIAVVLYLGIVHFGLDFAKIMVLLLIYGRLSPIINQFFAIYNGINSGLASVVAVERLKEELSVSREMCIGKEEAGFKERIAFDNVDFGYTDVPVVANVNFDIKKGEHVAIIGETGSGKTTILDLLLLMLYPTKGDIRIDGISSRDIDINSWRNQIAYIGPENYLVAKSLMENLLIANDPKKVNEDAIHRSLQKASLTTFVRSLREGIHTPLLDRGQNLSTGQKQRLNLARAFLRDAKVYIMDEPTSALDFETEGVIREEIRKLKGEKTLIVVTHKKEVAEDADRVFEIRDGTLREISLTCK